MLITILCWSLVVLLVLAGARIIGDLRPGYFVGGLLFGIYNETCFEFCWTYSPHLGPFIYKDVSILIIAGWSALMFFSLCLSDKIMSRLWLRRPDRYLVLLDVAIFAVLGLLQEFIMHKTNYWTYNFPEHGAWYLQIIGYVIPALLMSALSRRVQDIIERP